MCIPDAGHVLLGEHEVKKPTYEAYNGAPEKDIIMISSINCLGVLP